MTAKRKRIEALEAKRRAFEASHVRRSEVPSFIFAVLDVVEGEAGPEVGARCWKRVVEGQAARVLRALEGKTAAQLADIYRRGGGKFAPPGERPRPGEAPHPDTLKAMTAPELARLYFQWGQP